MRLYSVGKVSWSVPRKVGHVVVWIKMEWGFPGTAAWVVWSKGRPLRDVLKALKAFSFVQIYLNSVIKDICGIWWYSLLDTGDTVYWFLAIHMLATGDTYAGYWWCIMSATPLTFIPPQNPGPNSGNKVTTLEIPVCPLAPHVCAFYAAINIRQKYWFYWSHWLCIWFHNILVRLLELAVFRWQEISFMFLLFIHGIRNISEFVHSLFVLLNLHLPGWSTARIEDSNYHKHKRHYTAVD